MTRNLRLQLGLALVVALAPAVARAQDASLQRVGTELARFNKPGALYGYLKSNDPAFFKAADEAGLAQVLDGSLSAKDFETAFTTKVGTLDASEKAAALQVESTFKGVLTTLDANRSAPRQGLSAAQVKQGDVVPELRSGLFDASASWMTKLWDASKVKSVGVKFVPGTLAWFNPNISIPELGIKAGVPLTDAQKKAVAELFSFQTTPDAPNPEGSAALPEYVGRAVNPNSNVLTIINDKGEVLSDLVAKGGGKNVASGYRDGRLDASEALMDSELSRNLGNAGVKNYDALAVIQPEGLDGKSITIRVPRSMLRHMDIDKLSDSELKATLERLTNEIAIREGLPSLSIQDWLKTYLPRTSGENWGLLTGLGVEHGSDYTRDNHALAETVDWGWVKLNDARNTDQSSHEWDNIKETIERVNQILPDSEKANVDDAKAIFDAAYAKGVDEGKTQTVQFSKDVLERMDLADLRTLAEETKNPSKPGESLSSSASKDDVIAWLEASGHVVDPKAAAIAETAPSKTDGMIAAIDAPAKDGHAATTAVAKAAVAPAVATPPAVTTTSATDAAPATTVRGFLGNAFASIKSRLGFTRDKTSDPMKSLLDTRVADDADPAKADDAR